MAEFKIEIAGHTAAVSSLYDSSRDYCRDYWTEKCPEFAIQVTREDLVFEQADLDREAAEDGFRRRVFTDPFLDRAAIQRKMADYLIRRNVLMIHGSAIAVDGRGYLFMAKSGTGKSTQAELWRIHRGAEVINGDRIMLRSGQYGWEAVGVPFCGSSGIRENRILPLAAVIVLSQAPVTTVAPLTGMRAFRSIWEGCTLQTWNRQDVDLCAMHVEALLGSVPVLHLACTPDISAVEALEAVLN